MAGGVGSAELGRWGERAAAEHLQSVGMAVLDRNWRCRLGEIDIVARDGDTLVFCEVKTRRAAGFGPPAEAVTATKVRRLRRLAGLWLAAHRPGARAVRLDVIAVLGSPSGPLRIDHLRDVGR